MVNNNPAVKAPVTVKGNLSGTLAGVAATFAVGALAHAGYLATAAAFLGQPEATVSLLAMAVIGGIVNYGVTHVAAMKQLNDLYDALPTIKTYSAPSDFPTEKTKFGG